MIRLEDIQTDNGCLQHLLAAESLAPLQPGYDFEQTQIVLKAMKATLLNRKGLDKPWIFCSSTATTVRDFVCAPISVSGCQSPQFQGFTMVTGQVKLSDIIQRRIADYLRISNDSTHPDSAPLALHIKEIISIVNNTQPDPYLAVPDTIGGVSVKKGVYGWNTAGAAPLGGYYVKIPQVTSPLAHPNGKLQGTQFYTLKSEAVRLSEQEFLRSVFV